MTTLGFSIQDILSDLDQLQQTSPRQVLSSKQQQQQQQQPLPLHPILQLGRSFQDPDSPTPTLTLPADPDPVPDEQQSQIQFQSLLKSFDSSSSSSSTSTTDHVQLASLFVASAQKALQLDQPQTSTVPYTSISLENSSRIETLHGTIAQLQARAEDKEKALQAALNAVLSEMEKGRDD